MSRPWVSTRPRLSDRVLEPVFAVFCGTMAGLDGPALVFGYLLWRCLVLALDVSRERASFPMNGRRHVLKSWPPFYEAVISGRKSFEIRRDDRGFQVGDELVLQEFSPTDQTYTGRQTQRVVTYVSAHDQHAGTVVLGIREVW